ncbi:MAG: MarR family transcriptional regulator [Halobacteriales archaeon]
MSQREADGLEATLEVFETRGGPLSVVEIAEALGITRKAAARRLHVLYDRGALDREPTAADDPRPGFIYRRVR